MAILGKGVGQFGKTASERKEKMEDIAATGKMYETIYKTREEQKGKQARLTAADKLAALTGGTPAERFFAEVRSTDELKPKDIRNALFRASDGKVIAEVMPTEEEANKKRLDPKNEGKVYIQGQKAFILKGKEFIEINYQDLLKS